MSSPSDMDREFKQTINKSFNFNLHIKNLFNKVCHSDPDHLVVPFFEVGLADFDLTTYPKRKGMVIAKTPMKCGPAMEWLKREVIGPGNSYITGPYYNMGMVESRGFVDKWFRNPQIPLKEKHDIIYMNVPTSNSKTKSNSFANTNGSSSGRFVSPLTEDPELISVNIPIANSEKKRK